MSSTRNGRSKDRFVNYQNKLQQELFLEGLGLYLEPKNSSAHQTHSAKKFSEGIFLSGISQSYQDYTAKQIVKQGVDLIENYMENLSEHLEVIDNLEDLVMLSRLRAINNNELEQTEQDLHFYSYKIQEFFSYQKLGWADKKISDLKKSKKICFNTSSNQNYKKNNYEYIKNNPIYHEDVLAIYDKNVFIEHKFWYCRSDVINNIKSFQAQI
jgi:hypothetical protein